MNRRLILVTAMVMGYQLLPAQGQLTVTVERIHERKGSVMIGLFADKDSFLKEPEYGKVVPVADDGEIIAVFTNIKPGDYAISIIHDANDNGKLDTNGLGIPREGFGFGNNAMGMFGPPSFVKAKVTIGKLPIRQVLRMKYMF